MTTKVVNTLKYLGLFSIVFFTLISCEKEIESIGVNLVDNNTFSTNTATSEVLTTSKNIERVPTNNLAQYLLGVYADNEFGKIKASIVSQISLPATGENYNYGKNPIIDSVLISIPYQATLEENGSEGEPIFSIDSVIGNQDEEFLITVYELKTFLNTLDPNNPANPAIYYSDKEFLKGDSPLYSGNFKVNKNDTVSYIKRYLADGITVYDTDTIKLDNSVPSIKLPLDETIIKQLFIDNAARTEFETFDNFSHYFRGLIIEASELASDNSHLLSLNLTGAKMTIYYSRDEDEDADEDLNGNGTNGEQGVRTKQSYDFTFGTLIKANVLERDYTNSKQSGEDRLYVQGAAGSMATVELFENEDIVDLQSRNWLVTEANLVFYVDQDASSSIVPEQLFIYNYDDNEQLRDVMTEGIGVVGGLLERDENGNPYRYIFKITDYISEILKSTEALDLVKLGVKVYNPTDLPTAITDIKIEDTSWNPKGVVLYNHNTSAEEKRVKLELFYSEINN